MPTWQRIGVALAYTIALLVGALLYNEVLVQGLLPLINMSGTFSTPVAWLERIVPAVLLILLVAVWGWVIVGAVQDERSVNRRVRR